MERSSGCYDASAEHSLRREGASSFRKGSMKRW
jgi:hypothetical protein